MVRLLSTALQAMLFMGVHCAVLSLIYLTSGAAFSFHCSLLKDHAHKRMSSFRQTRQRMGLLFSRQCEGTEECESKEKHLLTGSISQLKSNAQELHVIISGAPAAGKGTQCEFIQTHFGVVHISTGELLRTAMRENTDLGNAVRVYMDAGKLVPDNIIIGVVCARLSQQDCQERGWLLDGFPRTEAQAEALNESGHVADCFVLLDVSQGMLLDRITGRRTDPATGKVYHITHNPPSDPEVVQRLIQRSDDTAEKLIGRYADYERHTGAIRSFYDDRTIVVDGGASKDTISARLHAVLSKIKVAKKPEVDVDE